MSIDPLIWMLALGAGYGWLYGRNMGDHGLRQIGNILIAVAGAVVAEPLISEIMKVTVFGAIWELTFLMSLLFMLFAETLLGGPYIVQHVVEHAFSFFEFGFQAVLGAVTALCLVHRVRAAGKPQRATRIRVNEP